MSDEGLLPIDTKPRASKAANEIIAGLHLEWSQAWWREHAMELIENLDALHETVRELRADLEKERAENERLRGTNRARFWLLTKLGGR